jgi:hypothetical protein
MTKHGYFIGALLFVFVLAFAGSATAQNAPDRLEGKAKVEGQAGDRSFDFRIQGGEADRGQPPREGDRGLPGPQGPMGERGPQGPSGPAGGGAVLGMDPTIALLVGLAVLAVVIVAIVAASRSRE